MQNEPAVFNQKKLLFFYILMAAVLGWFLFMQLFGADERHKEQNGTCLPYSGSFLWLKPDGSREEITIPGQYDVAVGETMILVSRLPDDYDEASIAIRSSLQDVRIYVGDELRVEYSTRGTRLVGKTSASRYVFCPTSSSDAGKELRIELTTYTRNYSGVVNEVYCGSAAGIWQFLFDKYGLQTFIAFFILFAGLITIFFSFTLGIIYHTRFDMEYLGWCMLMGAVWMLGESKLRQILVPNASALASLCFVMILLGPLPILFYADSVQHGRHHLLYTCIGALAVLDFSVSSILLVTGVADYIETLPMGQFLLLATLLLVLINLFTDIRASKNRTDRLLLIGLLFALICISIEAISVYFVVSLSGLFMGTGMLVLLFVNVIRTIKNIQHMEQKRQEDEILRNRRQTEQMSLQTMLTLAATIEAKNEYTRGHSYRVSEYAGLLAQELGWSPEEIQNLKYTALLHDIGRIGIPDQILNKPTRLTAEEYALIQDHTVIGEEILKDATFLPHLAEVARSHHERYDGTGYPDGRSGDAIPLYARIVALADSYDAMNSRRIYRNRLSKEMIYEEIRKNRGKQFDPALADLFLCLMKENRLRVPESDSNVLNASELPSVDSTIGKFIFDVMSAMKSQEDAASYDFLTGLPMRHLGERLAAEFMQEHNGYLIFLDMDNLKKINDLYGHKAGDRALKLLGNLLADYQEAAVACRLGGDEFLLFVPEITREAISEQMQQLFETFRQRTAGDVEVRCASLSAGLCLCNREDAFEDCYSKADKALYYVKQNGKNQFFFYQQIDRSDLSAVSTGKNLAIVARSLRDTGTYVGALALSYREFARQYEYMNQLDTRSHCHCYLVMITMDTAIDTIPHIETIEQALDCMEQAIRQTIRRVDICTRYSSMQYLIILFDPIESGIPGIMERIFSQYYQLYGQKSFVPRYEYLKMTGEESANTAQSQT